MPRLRLCRDSRAGDARWNELGCSAVCFSRPSLGEKLVEALPVKADDHFIIYHNCGSDLAAVSAHQLKHRPLISSHIALLEWKPSLREVGFCLIARRSARLGEEDDFLGSHRITLDRAIGSVIYEAFCPVVSI